MACVAVVAAGGRGQRQARRVNRESPCEGIERREAGGVCVGVDGRVERRCDLRIVIVMIGRIMIGTM